MAILGNIPYFQTNPFATFFRHDFPYAKLPEGEWDTWPWHAMAMASQKILPQRSAQIPPSMGFPKCQGPQVVPTSGHLARGNQC